MRAEPWRYYEQAVEQNPYRGEVTLSIVPKGDREYFAGEPIPVEFVYRNVGTGSVGVGQSNGERTADLTWIATGPDGTTVPLAANSSIDMILGVGDGSGAVLSLEPGKEYRDQLDLARHLIFTAAGTYEIAVLSSRISSFHRRDNPRGTGMSGFGRGVPSNRILVRVREPRPGEIAAYAARLRDIYQRTKNLPQQSWPASDERTSAVMQLRGLHAKEAIPDYIELLGSEYYRVSGEIGLYYVPETTASLEALKAYLAAPEHGITDQERHLYTALWHKARGDTEMLLWREPEELRREFEMMAAGKQGKARTQTNVGMIRSLRIESTTQALEIATHFDDLDHAQKYQAMLALANYPTTETVSILERYLQDSDGELRSEAMRGLLRFDQQRYLDVVLADLASSAPQYGIRHLVHGLPLELSRDWQLRLARAFTSRTGIDKSQSWQYLSKVATTPDLVPILEDHLANLQKPERVEPYVLVILARFEPEKVRERALAWLKTHGTTYSGSRELRKFLIKEPEVRAGIQKELEQEEYAPILEVLDESAAADDGIVQWIVARLRSRLAGGKQLYAETRALSQISGRLIAPVYQGKDIDVGATQNALEQWEQWWKSAKLLSPDERKKQNIEYALQLLRDPAKAIYWPTIDMQLKQLTGKDPVGREYRKRGPRPVEQRDGDTARQEAVAAWEAELQK